MKSKDQTLLEEAYGLICELHDETGSAKGPAKRHIIYFNGKNGKDIYDWVDKNESHTVCIYVDYITSSLRFPMALKNRVKSIDMLTFKKMWQNETFRSLSKNVAVIIPIDVKLPLAVMDRFEKLDIGPVVYNALTPDGPEANKPGHYNALTPDGPEANEPGHYKS